MTTNTLYIERDNTRYFENVNKKIRFNGNILYVPTETTRQFSKEIDNLVNIDGNVYTIRYNKILKMFECDNTKTYSVDTLQVFRPSQCNFIQLTEKADKELTDNKSIEYRYKGKNYVITLDENGNAHANAETKKVIAVFTN